MSGSGRPVAASSTSRETVEPTTVKRSLSDRVSRFGRKLRPTVLELLGVLGMSIGFWLLAGPAGIVVAVAVTLLWYAFAGVYGFAAGQFLLAAALPAQVDTGILGPELLATEAALVLLLVGRDYRGAPSGRQYRYLLRTAVVTALLVAAALGVGIESAAVADETVVVAAVGTAFLVMTAALYGWGRLVVSPVVDERAQPGVIATADRTESDTDPDSDTDTRLRAST
jgi:hypothetical protein